MGVVTERARLSRWTIALGLALSACLGPRPMEAEPMQTAASLHIVSSSPRSGATVDGPVDELRLRFSKPARLLEVTISGPDGDMPTMVDSAEETYEYSIPLPDFGTGKYEARWRASAAGEESSGRLTFSVR